MYVGSYLCCVALCVVYNILQLLRTSEGRDGDGAADYSGAVKKTTELQEYRYTTPSRHGSEHKK